MNFFNKVASTCLLLFLAFTASTQCITNKRLETFSGDSILYSCPGQNGDLVALKSFSASTPVLYLITDQKDTIRSIALTSIIDLKGLNGPEYHIYGYSYKGNVNPVIGKHLSNASIASLCAARSINYITVIRKIGTPPILDPSSLGALLVCAPDAKPDIITIEAAFSSAGLKKYIVTDEKNNLVAISDQNKIDVNALPCKTCKIYAVSFIGQFDSKLGQPINSLFTPCAAISENYMTIVRDFPQGGQIQFVDSSKNVFICSESSKHQILAAQIVNNLGNKQAFILTDTFNKVLSLQQSSFVPTLALSKGVCKIWGLSYTGRLALSKYVGKSIQSVSWSDDCFALTTNSLTISKSPPNGGILSLINTRDRFIQLCTKDSASPLKFSLEKAKGMFNLLILTNAKGNIISWTPAKELDPTSLKAGDYRMYNLSYTGNLTLKRDSLIGSSVASDDCFDFSDDFVQIHIDTDVTPPGILTFSDFSMTKFICVQDNTPSSLKFNYSSPIDSNTIFLVTDSADLFLFSLTTNAIELKQLKNSTYKIFAATYTGSILVKAGQNIQKTNLFSACYQLSVHPLILNKGTVLAGNISFQSSRDSLRICSTDSISAFKLTSDITHQTPFRYLLTTHLDTIIRILPDDQLMITTSMIGSFKIWALAYSGELLLKPGDYIKKSSASTGCSDLSANWLTLIKEQPIGGKISLNNGDTSYQICYKDGRPDLLSFRSTTPSGLLYQYVGTDEDGFIIAFNVNSMNLESLPGKLSKVYGISYLGTVTARIGDRIDQVVFSSGCFDISNNYIQVSTNEISAGNIRSNRNNSKLLYCSFLSTPDTIRLTYNSVSVGVSYRYIGINSDTIQFVSADGVISSYDIANGSTDIYGVAFLRGQFLAKVGDKLSVTQLVDSCYGISTNSIRIEKYNPNAGKLKTGDGSSDIYLCPHDGKSDFISLTAEGNTPLSYGYLITNSQDSIIAFTTESNIDFEPFPSGLCRIFGLSYLGDVQFKNKTITSASLATACFAVSTNFVNVFKSSADGGRISFANRDSLIKICVGDLRPDTLRPMHSTTVKLKYSYLITDTQNKLISIFDETQYYDFNGLDEGTCRLYGVSYGGFLNVFRNDDVTTALLSTGCYDLSDNYLTIEKSTQGDKCKINGLTGLERAFTHVFPNPAKDYVNIALNSKFLRNGEPVLTLMAASGGICKKFFLNSQNIDNEPYMISTSDLTPGLYFLMFKNGYIFDKLKIIVIK